jgi:hypothetical protein
LSATMTFIGLIQVGLCFLLPVTGKSHQLQSINGSEPSAPCQIFFAFLLWELWVSVPSV